MQRRYWWDRGGAQRHKWNGIRRERTVVNVSRRQINRELWQMYREMYFGADADWPSFRAAALGLPMPESPGYFKWQKEPKP
jgi:hypothetical protein